MDKKRHLFIFFDERAWLRAGVFLSNKELILLI
jgi:hypothetical protein